MSGQVSRRSVIYAGVAGVIGLGAGMLIGSNLTSPTPAGGGQPQVVTTTQRVTERTTITSTVMSTVPVTITRTVTATPPSPELETIKLVQIPILAIAPVLIAQYYGLFDEEGIMVEIEPTPGAGPTIEAVISGTADIGFTGHPAVWKLADTRGIYLKLVHQGGVTGSQYRGRKIDPEKSTLLLVKKGSGIKKIEDLRGRNVAINVLNDLPHVSLSILLKRAGYDPQTFVNWVEIPFPQMPAALAAGRVDAAVASAPYSILILAQGIGEPLVDPPLLPTASIFLPTIGDPALLGAWWTSEETLRRKARAIVKFMRAVANGVRYMYGDEEKAIEIISKGLNLDPAIAKTAYEGYGFAADPDGFTRIDLLEPQMNAYLEIGFLTKPLDLKRFTFTAEEVLKT